MWSGLQFSGISGNLHVVEDKEEPKWRQNYWEAELEISRGWCLSLSVSFLNKLHLLLEFLLLFFTDYKEIQEFVKHREAKVRKLKLPATQKSITTNTLAYFLLTFRIIHPSILPFIHHPHSSSYPAIYPYIVRHLCRLLYKVCIVTDYQMFWFLPFKL